MLPKTPKNPWQTKTVQTVYATQWIKVEEHDAINPAGQATKYGVVRFQNLAIGVLPLTDDYQTYLVGQHRYPLDIYSWELPEGGCPQGEEPLFAAKRELEEETGLRAKEYTHLLDLHVSNSVTDEKATVFIAKGLSQGESNPEPSENITCVKLPFDDVFQMVLNGEITDSISVAAILKAKFLIDNGHL